MCALSVRYLNEYIFTNMVKCITAEGADIVDFDADKNNKVFYFATQRKILKIHIENLEPSQDFESIESPFAEPIKAVGILLG